MGKFSERARVALEWFGIETRAADSSAGGLVIPSRELSARGVTPSEALALHTVFRAVQIIATSVRQLTLDSYRGGSADETKHPLLVNPNAFQELGVFLEATAVSLATSGNFFWLTTRDTSGQVINLEVLNAHAVEVNVTATGKVTGYWYDGKARKPEDIIHGRLFSVPGKARGVGPIQQAQADLRGAIDVRDYAGNWFHDSGLPAGGNYLSTTQNPAPETARAVRDGWLKATRDREGIPILIGGVELKSFMLTPAEAKWLEAQSFDVLTVTRLFGVPASLMLAPSEGKSQAYQNVSQEWLGYVRFTLMAYLAPIEEALTSVLPAGVTSRFNVEGLLRADATTRYAAHRSGIDAGWLLPSEVRAIEGLPPVEGIDDRPRVAAKPEPLDLGELKATPTGEDPARD